MSYERALVTGAHGTLGAVLMERLREAGAQPVAWDRARVGVQDYAVMEAFARQVQPQVIFHLAIPSQPDPGGQDQGWQVHVRWTHELAWIARVIGARFVFASTAMVYSSGQPGPLWPSTTPDATRGYGLQKLQAEQVTRAQNPDAVIARLGWQISRVQQPWPGNTMIAQLQAQHERGEPILASARWRPACSFLEDSADALLELSRAEAGIYHVDSNAAGHSFEQIARALSARFELGWRVQPTSEPEQDQRLLDGRLSLPALAQRLPALRRDL